jgi:hypothetical protein
MSVLRTNRFQTLTGQTVKLPLQIESTYFGTNTQSQQIISTTSETLITGASVTVTPLLTGSRIFVSFMHMFGNNSASAMWVQWRLKENTVNKLIQSMYFKDQYGGGIGPRMLFNGFVPGTTTTAGVALTYTISFQSPNTTPAYYANWDNNSGLGYFSVSSLTVMEIAQ